MDRGASRSNSKTAKRAKSISSRTIEPNPARRPTHPGELFQDIVLAELKLSVSEAARQLGVSRQTLHAILSERSAVTPEMAVRLGKFCGDGPDIWLRMQMAHDLWQARRDLAETVKQIPTLHAV